LPTSALNMDDYIGIKYIDTCIDSNLNFMSNSYRQIYNLKTAMKLKIINIIKSNGLYSIIIHW